MTRGVRTETVAALLVAGLALAAALHAEAPKRRVIGISQCNLGEHGASSDTEASGKAAAAHPGLEVVFKEQHQNDSLVQRARVEELVAQKVDAMVTRAFRRSSPASTCRTGTSTRRTSASRLAYLPLGVETARELYRRLAALG